MATSPTDYATAADVKLIAPEFEDVDDSWIDLWIQCAQEKLSPRRFGRLLCKCSALWVAHFLAVSPQTPDDSGGIATESDENGVLTAEADGPASRSFGLLAVAEDADGTGYGSTKYGRMFMVLRRCVRGTGSGVVARDDVSLTTSCGDC